MILYSPCDCDAPYEGCYRCAVGYVINTMGGVDHCECIAQGNPFCEKCGGRLHSDFEEAFARAAAPYDRLAKARAQSKGMVGQDRASGVTWFSQDKELAAADLIADVDDDPVSFDAALWFVAEQVRLGQVVPEPLREWGYKAIRGTIKRPAGQGKYIGATFWRDRLIVELLEDLVKEQKLRPTSADADKGLSACHAVAQAFQLLKLKPNSYQSIRRIWSRRKNLLSYKFPESV